MRRRLPGRCSALWYNCYPAAGLHGRYRQFGVGGIIAVFALLIRKELLLDPVRDFFIESLSVIMQVTCFKYTKKRYGEGRRIF